MMKKFYTNTGKVKAATLDHGAQAWLQRVGIAGLIFFTVKGLIWVAVSWWLLS